MIVLGLESSCDETAAAVVDGSGKIFSHVVSSQIKQHKQYGGVVPELAARSHMNLMPQVVQQALIEAELDISAIDAVAATGGPGLIGGVLVGTMFAKSIAAARDIPYIAVNHLEGHALTPRLVDDVEFPFLLLLISGGHCQFLIAKGVGDYELLGGTLDDSCGEAFDKVAKMMGLPYPGGPEIESLAEQGDAQAFAFPRPLKGRPGCDFSFSGLKTAVREVLLKHSGSHSLQLKRDIAASFQQAVQECLVDRLGNAVKRIPAEVSTCVIAGGVAANQAIRKSLSERLDESKLKLVSPPLSLCTDNAVMIAWAGVEYMRLNRHSSLAFSPRPRWPL